MRKLWLATGLILVASSCVTVAPPPLEPGVAYKRDLKFTIEHWDGKKWAGKQLVEGAGIYPSRGKKFRLKLYPPRVADLVHFTTCVRSLRFTPKKKRGYYTIEFPASPLEYDRACPVELTVIDKKKGHHAWGIFTFKSHRENLSAKVSCNGITTAFKSTSFCQSLAGMPLRFEFDRPVAATKLPGCELEPPERGNIWSVEMPEGECVVFFLDKTDERMAHMAVLYGYESEPLR